MAHSRIPGPQIGFSRWLPARTPGPLGVNDQNDPRVRSQRGDTPGPLGVNDWNDPMLRRLARHDAPLGHGYPWSCGGAALTPRQNDPQTWGARAVRGALDADRLRKIFPRAKRDLLERVANELNRDLGRFGLDSTLRQSHFFAQVREEGGASLTARSEGLNYSPEGLKATFEYYRKHPSEALADGYAKDPKTHKFTRLADETTIANKTYGNRKDLGNHGLDSGDGWRYRGRGFFQVTGRANYRDVTLKYRELYSVTDIDFETNPDLMCEFPFSLRTAVCFWNRHGLFKLADLGHSGAHVDQITAVVNLRTGSYGARRQHFREAYRALA